MYGRDLFNHELCGFDATVFVDVQAVRQLHDAAPGGSCLVERDGIDDVTAVRRPYPQFEMLLAHRPLFDNLEIAAPDGLRKTCPPGTSLTQPACKVEIQCPVGQCAVADDCAADLSPSSSLVMYSQDGREKKKRRKKSYKNPTEKPYDFYYIFPHILNVF